MSEEFKVELGVELDEASLQAAEQRIKNIGKNSKVKVDVDANDNGSTAKASNGIKQIEQSAKSASASTKSFGDTLKKSLSIGSAAAITAKGIRMIESAAKDAVTAVKDIDGAITDLRMATGESYEEVQRLVQGYNQMGQAIGATTTEVSASADAWLRQGNSIKETNTLIKDSMILSKVGQIDSADATKYLTSAMKGYGVEVQNVQNIVDKLCAVDLVSATDAAGLAEAMSRTAVTAEMAGVSMDELLGYLATVGEVTQKSMSSIGESFKTIFTRMHDIKADKLELVDEDGTTELLSDVELTLKNVGIDLRETVTEFNDASDVLDNLHDKWDLLNSVQQAALSKAFAGTRQSENFKVLMENYDVAKQYMETAANSAGTAEQKFSAYLDSIEAKTKSLQAAFESLSVNTFSTEMLGGIIEASTALLQFLDNTNLLKGTLAGLAAAGAIKGFTVMATGISNAAMKLNEFNAAMKLVKMGDLGTDEIQKLISLTANLSQSQLKAVLSSKSLTTQQRLAILTSRGMSEAEAQATLTTMGLATAEGTATATTFSLSGAIKGLWATLMANPLILVVAGITATVSAYSTYKQKVEEARQALIENGNAASENAQSLESAYVEYMKYAGKTKLSSSEESAFQSAIEGVTSALGGKSSALSSAAAGTDEYTESVKKATAELLKEDWIEAIKARQAAMEELQDESWSWWNGSQVTLDLSGRTGIEEFVDAKEVVEKLMQNYMDEGTYGLELEPLDWDSDHTNMDALVDYYYKLIDVQNALAENGNMDNDIYKDATSIINSLSDSVQNYVESKYNELKLDYEVKNGIPTTTEQYQTMKDSIIEASGANESFRNELKSMLDNDFSDLIDISVLKEQIENISDLTDEQLNEIKSKFADDSISEWFNSLLPDDKKLVYEIGLKSDDTTLYTLTRWKSELESMKLASELSSESISDFNDIINSTADNNFSEYIEGYTENLSSLQDALSKIDTGTLEQSDKVDLALNFPELAPYVNDTDLLRDAIQNLIDTSNQDMNSTIDQMIDNLAESAPEAAAALEAVREAINGLTSASGWDFDIDAEVEKFDNLYAAMKESVSGTGLSTKGIENVKAMFQGLDGYDPSVLFERTEHGIHLNTTALRALQSEYESTKKLDIQERLQDLKQEYNDSAKAVEGLTDAQAKNVLEQKGLRSTDAILADIENVQTLAAQYEGLTSAYNKWIMAQSAGEEGDMYDNVTDSLEDIKKLYDDGLIGTNAFRSAVQMMTNEDLSTANIDKLIATYEAGYPAMKRYFTEGQEGAITFLEDIQNINSEWAHMNEDGTWEINFGVGNDEEIANAISEMTGLQISTEEVQMIMRKLSDYGFDIKLDSAYTSVDELKSRIEETESKLKELGQEPVDININAEGESAQTELDKAKQKIEEIKNSDASIEVKTAQLEDAYAKVDVLVAKVNQPAFMSIDVTQVDSELQGALTTLQEYQTAVNNLNALEIKGADTSEIEAAKGKVDELAGKIQELPDDVKTKIGLETDGSIEDIKSQISNDEVKISVTADTTQATTEIEGIEGESVEVEVTTSGNEALDNLKSALEGLEDKDIKITAEVTGLEDVQALSDSVKNVENKEATATVTSVGKDDAVALADAVEKIVDKNATATVTSVGKDDAVALSQAIENVTNKTVTTTAVTEGKDDVDALKASIDSLYDRTVTSTVKVVGTKLVIALKEAIDSLYSKTVSAGANVFGTSAVRSLKSAIDSLYSKTVTATTVTRKVAGVDGTAHAQGTAFVEGDWGTKESGVALGGELGQELIVRDGHFFTIGDDAAEFFKYKKGDIIFNAEQTKQIFEKGKITHGSGRGKAMAEGTAFSSGSGKFTQSGKTVYNSSQAKKGSSSKSSSSKSSSKSSSSADDFKETFDWIEVAIDRIERAISKLDTKASSVYRTWSERNKNLTSEMTKVSEEINLQQAAYTRYMKQANSVGLSTSWMNKVKNGLVDINTITDETLADKIKEAQEWVDKAKDCQDAILDLQETLSGLYSTAFENVSTQYDGILAVVEHEQSMIEEYISQAEEKGYITSTKYYEALMQSEQEAIAKLQKEKADLTTAMNNAVNSGAIKRGSEEWYNMVQAIDEVTLSIEEGNTALIEYAAAIREIKWEIFDLIEQKISAVTTEAQFLIDLLSSADLYNDKGQLTDEGQSTMGLHAVNYDIYMAQADDYAQEIKKIDAELANDPANEEIAERRQELLELQQEMILAAEDEKEAIVDMVREGIELELDALKDLIDTYTEALDAQKDLYDYQNKIKDQTTEIATLQKQLQAYSGDTSEETKATVQKLKVSLEEAKSNLEDSEYDKYISDQKQLLDELYLDYETTLNMRLDNIDKLISDMITSINSNSGTIASTLYSAADKVGYTMSESMNTIWKEAYASTQSDSQLRVQQATAILNQLVANGQITQYDANQILTALGSGSAAQAEQALSIIQQLVADGSITQSTGNSIIASLNTSSQKAALDALSIVNKLTQNGTLSTADANKIIQALVTGDAQDLQNTANIISRLLSNNQIDTQNAATLLTALNGNTAAENLNTLNLINRLIQNSALSTADATKLWTALITGNSQDLANTTSIISRLLTNQQISSAEAANLIATLNGAKAADLQNALSIVNKLTQNGTLSTADANKIIQALVTGDAAAVQNAQSIISKLEAQGKISTADATGLKTALNTAMTNAQSANTNIVTTYGKDLGSKLTTVNTSLSNIKASVDAIVAKLNATASTQTAAASSSSVAKAPTPTPAPAATPAKTTTSTPAKTTTTTTKTTSTTKTKKQKYGVALAIINGNYGWGTGDTRKKRLKAKGFDATEIQNIVNKLMKEGYVNSGKWSGRYEGITNLAPYHYNKFAQGVHNLKKDQLAITQEKGTEYINSPTAGLLTPLTQGSDVFNAAASDNLWNMANNPEQFIQDNLELNQNIGNVPNISGDTNSNVTINFENITLPNVTNYEEFMNAMVKDKKFESLVRDMTVNRAFGNASSLHKYKHKW